jgi:hypothetical protein
MYNLRYEFANPSEDAVKENKYEPAAKEFCFVRNVVSVPLTKNNEIVSCAG